ncbi:hypothetical protein Gotri_008810 [Gossypium trilobum]|uniref:Mitochondrial import inner membrane translocase subunit n=1 Tax=Gossypium trilobum TaxID=34281 RepID=A0A7J9EKG0_9ROSI|nr:hypothetical protein [Gossypium trilobum]
MDSFSTGSSGTGSPQISTDEFMDQMKAQLAQAYAQEFLEVPLSFLYLNSVPGTVRGKCFEKCISKPGSSLSGSESSCISRCVDRYIEATGIVGRALFTSR